ncbi:hypothetical protein A33K_15758 [Burkholderia humptydooensis MSMB43]|nr:hypothetical protein A33K_15758 [Burkholderia humptydooensis MSMB43]
MTIGRWSNAARLQYPERTDPSGAAMKRFLSRVTLSCLALAVALVASVAQAQKQTYHFDEGGTTPTGVTSQPASAPAQARTRQAKPHRHPVHRSKHHRTHRRARSVRSDSFYSHP